MTNEQESLRAAAYEDYKEAAGWSSAADAGNVDFDNGFDRGFQAGLNQVRNVSARLVSGGAQ